MSDEKEIQELKKQIDELSHQIFTYHLDVLQFMDRLHDFMADTDIQGIKDSSVLWQVSQIINDKKLKQRSKSRWK